MIRVNKIRYTKSLTKSLLQTTILYRNETERKVFICLYWNLFVVFSICKIIIVVPVLVK